jgi:cytochrome c oxidase cbb3-type subunit 3
MPRVCIAATLGVIIFLAMPIRGQQAPAPGGRGRGTGPAFVAYPDRPPGDPAAIERGRTLFVTNCAACHGDDTRGGNGGPSLIRSAVVLDDQKGETIAPVVREGRPDRGMPKFVMTGEQISDIAAFMHSFRVNGNERARLRPATIVVGDARAGETFFKARCGSCHSTAGDLGAITTRIPDARTLQQTWLLPGSMSGRGGPPPARPKATRATVTLPSGEKIQGEVERADDFVIALRLSDGTHRSFRITNGAPKVDIHDPLQPHKDLLRTYTDTDIHNVTAYLVTLK